MSTKNPGVYNLTRTIRAILKRYRKETPSLIMHLYSTGFRLGQPDSTLHAYDGELKHWIDCIREQKMPNDILDVLDESDVKFYDGCLIVEVHDHRAIDQGNQASTNDDPSVSQNSPHLKSSAVAQINRSKKDNNNRDLPQDLPNDQVTLHRLVLSPTCETLWKDLQIMNEARISHMAGIAKEIKGSQYKWGPMTEEEAVIVESAILERTTPPLCLSPSIITTRIANQLLCDTTLQPSTHQKGPRKRPLNSGEEEAMRRKRDRQEKYMHIADESYGQAFAPTFSRVDLIKRMRNTSLQLAQAQEDSLSASQQPDQAHSPAPNLSPSGAHHDQRMAHSTSVDSKQVTSAEAYPPLQGPNAPQQSIHHPQLPNPAAQAAAMSPPSIPPPVACAPIPTKKTAGAKKKGLANKNQLEDGASEAGSPAAVLAPTKKLSKKAMARLQMTPEERAADDEKKKQRAEARRLAKERKLAAAAAQNLNNPQPGTSQLSRPPPNSTSNNNQPAQSSGVLLAGQGGNISVPVVNAGIGRPQPHQDGIPVFTNNSISVNSSSHMQNTSIPTMLSNSNTSLPPHNHSIPVPSLSNNSIPVPMSQSDHSIHVPSNNMMDGANDSNMQIDVNRSIPVFSTNHDIAVGHVNHGLQTHSNGIPVPSAHDTSIGIPVLQPNNSGGWPSMNIGSHHNIFQAGYQHGHHPHNLQRDPHATAGNNNANEMDIHVQQQQQQQQFTPNPTGYQNNMNNW